MGHVVSVHRGASPVLKDVQYLCIEVEDSPNQDLRQHFHDAITFIHDARCNGGQVLVHCMAGVSRSTTVVLAYLLTVTELCFEDLLTAVRHMRPCVSPNWGFRKQLTTFEREGLAEMRERLRNVFHLRERDHSYLLNNVAAAKEALGGKAKSSDDLANKFAELNPAGEAIHRRPNGRSAMRHGGPSAPGCDDKGPAAAGGTGFRNTRVHGSSADNDDGGREDDARGDEHDDFPMMAFSRDGAALAEERHRDLYHHNAAMTRSSSSTASDSGMGSRITRAASSLEFGCP